MCYRLECPANRYVFKSRLNCSESTAISDTITQMLQEHCTISNVTYHMSAVTATVTTDAVMMTMMMMTVKTQAHFLWSHLSLCFSLPSCCTTHSAVMCRCGSEFQWLASHLLCPTINCSLSLLRYDNADTLHKYLFTIITSDMDVQLYM